MKLLKNKRKNYLPFKKYNNEELSVGNIQLEIIVLSLMK